MRQLRVALLAVIVVASGLIGPATPAHAEPSPAGDSTVSASTATETPGGEFQVVTRVSPDDPPTGFTAQATDPEKTRAELAERARLLAEGSTAPHSALDCQKLALSERYEGFGPDHHGPVHR